MNGSAPRQLTDCPAGKQPLPPDRVIRALDDWYGIAEDGYLRGNVYYCSCGPNLLHLAPQDRS
jgi:hypothetical protein